MTRAPWDITPDMFLQPAEVERLLHHVRRAARDAPPSARPAARLDRLIIETLLFSGLRCSEFCRLRVSDVGTTARAPWLRVRGEGGGRVVWLPRHLGRLIGEFVADHRAAFVPPPIEPADPQQPLVFNERRRPFERTGLYRRVVQVLGRVGLGDRASVQLLRHTYGYLAYLRTGGNLLFVQRQLGHAHPMVTSVYAQLVPESYADLADAVGGVSSRSRAGAMPSRPRKVKRCQ